MSDPLVWLVLADPFSTRTFLDCGIAERLAARYGPRLRPVFLFDPDEAAAWAARFDGRALFQDDLVAGETRLIERALRRLPESALSRRCSSCVSASAKSNRPRSSSHQPWLMAFRSALGDSRSQSVPIE